MTAVATSLQGELLYFGKVPARGDFIRSAQHPALVDQLDRWQSQVMDRLSADPRWKLIYDRAPGLAFAVLGTASRVALAGHWLPSSDSSGRRFPFVTATTFQMPASKASWPAMPLALDRLWLRVEQVARVTHAATALEHAQASLSAPLHAPVETSVATSQLADFLDSHTLASLEQMLHAVGCEWSMRQSVLALGLMLTPAMTQGAGRLTKVLRLPLPAEAVVRAGVAAWWLSLVLSFFDRHELELGVFIVPRERGSELLIGFQGASALTLLAAVDAQTCQQHAVSLDQSDWVEAELVQDAGLRKLSNYLRDPGLSLGQALSIYREVFLGV